MLWPDLRSSCSSKGGDAGISISGMPTIIAPRKAIVYLLTNSLIAMLSHNQVEHS